jgi:F-type H+-transporting ATPase subunit epsilon
MITMADTTNLEIVTPSMVLVSEPVEMVVLPGSDGNIGALPKHSKVMSSLDRGVVDIFNDNKIVSRIMIDGGIAEINETSVVILAERAEKLDKSNRQVFEEKLSGFKSQENDADLNIANLAVKNSSFMKAVLDNIN